MVEKNFQNKPRLSRRETLLSTRAIPLLRYMVGYISQYSRFKFIHNPLSPLSLSFSDWSLKASFYDRSLSWQSYQWSRHAELYFIPIFDYFISCIGQIPYKGITLSLPGLVFGLWSAPSYIQTPALDSAVHCDLPESIFLLMNSEWCSRPMIHEKLTYRIEDITQEETFPFREELLNHR